MVLQKSIQLSNWMKSGEEKKASPQGDGYWKKKEFLCRSGGTVNSRRVGMWMEGKKCFSAELMEQPMCRDVDGSSPSHAEETEAHLSPPPCSEGIPWR